MGNDPRGGFAAASLEEISVLEHAIWWHVYPLGALGAPIRPEFPDDGETARLRRLEPWLDYAVELGCNGLLFGPLFQSTTHGYDTTDHFRIDPRLGSNEDFAWLVEQCSTRGLEIILDGVFNHVGVQHPLTRAALNGDPSPVLVADDGFPQHWEGHLDLAEFDHTNPATADLTVDVMEYWLERGIAGWRLDVAYAVPNTFWATVTNRVRERFPNAVFLGEIIHGDYTALITEGGLDTVTQYELWKGIWSSLKDRNLWELAHALERHAEFSATAPMQTFVGNHDVDRIASIVGDDGAAIAAMILFTLPGIPSVYQGDEQAFRGEKGTGVAADDPIRGPLPPSPAELAELGCWMFDHYRTLISLRRRHAWLVDGRIEIHHKENERLNYRVSSSSDVQQFVEVAIDLTEPIATASFSDGEEYSFPSGIDS
ncbi:glycosidase [Trueperella bonasi]|uniref:Glycosidase n=1 Tax=Trueperella bonasi TaxID=312286 RepID=A0ABT9NFX2_9ACTO|nr:alpha-amylase family protein [Trueperella bonasi]MDP9806260.1 glycosidase [Trueperella bonasi]